MEKIISASEARKRFAEIQDEVKSGVTYVVMSHGREQMRLVPPQPVNTTSDVDPNLEKDIDAFFSEYGDVLTELAKR